MLASSRNSLLQTVDEAATVVTPGTGFAADLLAAVGVFASDVQLRRVLTDSAVDVEAKRGLLNSLFAGKLSAPAVDLLVSAAGRRWARVQDYVTAVETAAVSQLAAHAQSQERLGEVEEELFRFTRLVLSDHDLERALESDAEPAAKEQLLQQIVGSRVSAETLMLLVHGAVSPRRRRVSEAYENFSEILAFRQQRAVADVTVARELTEQQKSRLEAALSASFGRKLVLNIRIDPDVVGGVRVQVGDEVMTSTIADRLAEVERRLAS